ncbi:guanylate kinase [Philodulcilactobacillus myokoensis]|uniref:Guanylate kinase n=1 Tax=Philodulcilactobacillus myokoensis TaxID=2929573 RepID=A0A9W6B0H7_9LACO|nr:AAA family ATPase [Philodulcilactobacillus myokoensis]GLB46572.1 guanylate kinase [Philodulcilactobacillus myokoensis]
MDKKIFIITGAAGTGKTTVCNYLCDHFKMARVITHTTRPPRKYEVNGRDYYFETAKSFAHHHFLESVQYDHHRYGSSYEGLDAAFRKSPRICIVLDTKGALTYLNQIHDLVTIIYLTASKHSLENRMIERGDDIDKIKNRLCSHENQRDQTLPNSLIGKATSIDNDNWARTRKVLNRLMQVKL